MDEAGARAPGGDPPEGAPGGVLIIGVGNEARGDDAAGLLVARRVADAHPELRVIEHTGDGLALMEHWRGCDMVVLVDAVSSGAAPGMIHRLDAAAAPLPGAMRLFSSHAFGIREGIELARALGRLPGRLLVLGIEGGGFDAGAPLTPAVLRAVDALGRELANFPCTNSDL